MIRRAFMLGCVLLLCAASVARAQGVAIDHKEVGCIVVGKYPKMNACITPAANLARSRVYFRPEGTPSWYYVEMKSDQPCLTGILPRPGKKLVGKKIEYYLEAQDRTFNPARTAEYGPVVVRSAQECKKQVPVAPFVNNATVAVFPGVPAGFVGGGIGTAAVVGIVGAGAAAAGTAAVVATSSNDDTTTTTVAVGVNTTTTTLAPTTTTTTTLPPANNRPPFALLTTNPDPASGNGPLTVTFDLCKSTDPDGDPLSFFFDFGDGGKSSGSCNVSHTYASSFREASNVRSLDRSYSAEGCVVDPGNLSACRTRNVNVTTTPPPTTLPACVPPSITITSPASGECFCAGDDEIPVTADAPNVVSVDFATDEIDCKTKAVIKSNDDTQSGSVQKDGRTWDATLSSCCGCFNVRAKATNSCGAVAAAQVNNVTEGDSSCCGFRLRATPGRGRATARWSSDLTVVGGRLQLVANGSAACFPERGRAYGAIALVDGENRVEATLLDGAGRPGLWRFDFTSTQSIGAGSIRVIAGEVVTLAASSVTFRLRGTPGERVAFTFLKK